MKELKQRIENLGLIDDSDFLLEYLWNNLDASDDELIAKYNELYEW